jgi:hypothetical protein
VSAAVSVSASVIPNAGAAVASLTLPPAVTITRTAGACGVASSGSDSASGAADGRADSPSLSVLLTGRAEKLLCQNIKMGAAMAMTTTANDNSLLRALRTIVCLLLFLARQEEACRAIVQGVVLE